MLNATGQINIMKFAKRGAMQLLARLVSPQGPGATHYNQMAMPPKDSDAITAGVVNSDANPGGISFMRLVVTTLTSHYTSHD